MKKTPIATYSITEVKVDGKEGRFEGVLWTQCGGAARAEMCTGTCLQGWHKKNYHHHPKKSREVLAKPLVFKDVGGNTGDNSPTINHDDLPET